MKILKNKKGMALFVVFGVILFLTTFAVSMTSRSTQFNRIVKVWRENERAEFMARGAIQIALLKLSIYPYEFVDSITWKRGDIYDKDWRKGIPGVKSNFDGQKVIQEDYYNQYVGVSWNKSTNSVIKNYNSDLQWSIATDQGDPFEGSGMVLFINLISKQNPDKKKWINAVEIGARGDETSELGVQRGSNDSTKMNTKQITELYRFNRVHVEGI